MRGASSAHLYRRKLLNLQALSWRSHTVPYGGIPPRQVYVKTSGSDDDVARSRSFAGHVMTPRIPPERLYRAVLSNIDNWRMDLEAIIEDAGPRGRTRALQLSMNLLQCQISLMRLAGEPVPDDMIQSQETVE
jgi:hypothetical protein